MCVDNEIIQEHNLLFGCLCLGCTQAIPFRKQDNNHSAIHSTTKTSHLQIEVELCYLRTLVFQLEEVCGINIVAHKMKNVSGGI